MSKADEKWDKIGDNPLVIINELIRMVDEASEKWADDVAEFLADESVKKVLELTIQMIAGEIPEPAKIAAICARLEAHALKFRTQYAAYMSYYKGTTDANMKKNHYKELYTGIDKLVDSLKYVVK